MQFIILCCSRTIIGQFTRKKVLGVGLTVVVLEHFQYLKTISRLKNVLNYWLSMAYCFIPGCCTGSDTVTPWSADDGVKNFSSSTSSTILV